MTTLVIGGSGFIGLNLVETGLRRSDRIITFDKIPLPSEAERAFSSLPGELSSVQGDITNLDNVLRIIKDNNIERIFHGAAVTAGQKGSWRNLMLFYL